jgi:protein-L-isoaspartate(D-aspartate) O-methyltransferase
MSLKEKNKNLSIYQDRDKLLSYITNEIGIKNQKLIEAFKKVPREEFVLPELKNLSYLDRALPIQENQTISQPSLVLIMTDLLKLTGKETVLEVGTGSGYQTAILSHLAKKVYTVERIKKLSKRAVKLFHKLNLKNIEAFCSDGTLGLPQKAPFDRIIVTAGAKTLPEKLISQLKNSGRMVIPVGQDPSNQKLTIVDRKNGSISVVELESVSFVPLVGQY